MATAKEERYLRWGQERDRLFLALREAPVDEKVRAYQQLEKQLRKEARTKFEDREIQRGITTDLLRATSSSNWTTLSPYLRRMERIGYSGMDERLLVCVLAAEAARGSRAGMKKVSALIEDAERRSRRRLDPSATLEEIRHALSRARRFAGLPEAKEVP